MIIDVRDLDGSALDWAVAISTGHDCVVTKLGSLRSVSNTLEIYAPSKNWSQGGQLIELMDSIVQVGGRWYATPVFEDVIELSGDTPLVAMCRGIVAAKLGDEVDIPEEVLK